MNTEKTENTSATAGDPHAVTIKRRIWQELVKIAGRQIDPENAEVYWEFGPVADPYGVFRVASRATSAHRGTLAARHRS